MNIKEAVELLKKYNLWRRDNNQVHEMPNPTQIGIAIDAVTEYFEECNGEIHT